jgi:hypothetical protein
LNKYILLLFYYLIYCSKYEDREKNNLTGEKKKKLYLKQPYAGLFFKAVAKGSLRQVAIFLRSFELQTHTELPFHPANGNIYYSFTPLFPQSSLYFSFFFRSEENYNSSP